MYLTYLVLLGLAIICNTVLLIVFYRHSQKSITTLTIFFLLLLVNIWFIPKFLTNAFHPTGITFENLSRIAALGYIFIPATLNIFTLSFGAFERIYKKMHFWFFLFLPPLVFLYLSWTSDLVGVHSYEQAVFHPWGYETPTGPLWGIYMIWYDLMILMAVSTLIWHYRTMIDQTKKKQSLYFIFAILFPLAVNTFTIGVLPIMGIFIFPVGLLLIDLVTIVGMALIFRYGWFEVSPMIILSNINQAILTVDTKGRIIHTNPYTEKLLKRKKEKLLGKQIENILFIRHGNKTKVNHCTQLLHLVLSRGKSMTFDSFSILLNGKSEITDVVSITPIIQQHKVIGANIFLRDTRKELVKEKQTKDYFSMLFHELKSPMTSIKAYNQVLAARFVNTTEENKLLFKKMDYQLDRLTRLINDFYEFSRVQSGKLTLKREFFGIHDFIESIVETMRITHQNRKFIIKGSTNSVVFADRDKIEQILLNFINNAIKFSPEKEEIVIHLTADAHKVIIGVQDFGKGIDPKFHKKIFERFFQVRTTTTQKTGLGVGLAIANTIIKAHQGKIWVNSNRDKGSTFYFSLPINTNH